MQRGKSENQSDATSFLLLPCYTSDGSLDTQSNKKTLHPEFSKKANDLLMIDARATGQPHNLTVGRGRIFHDSKDCLSYRKQDTGSGSNFCGPLSQTQSIA